MDVITETTTSTTDAPTSDLGAELRAWLADHLPADVVGVPFRGDPPPDELARLRAWNATLADAGWAAVSWPVEHGGRGAGVLDQVAVVAELVAAGAPGPINAIGLANIAPAIMAFGTHAQKERFLRPMLRGDEIWCQGFSEPDAGSDLASLTTTAVALPDGGWRIRGQKVWNTYGRLARWCELLVRTDPGASRHRGITALVVDMETPGIDVRPLRTATGEVEFYEIFFDDVDVPADALLGAVGDGWSVAMNTLSNERGGVAALHLHLRRRIAELIATARAAGVADDPVIRQHLARLHTGGETLRYLADRSIALAAAGRPPGPESSVIKIVWSTVSQELAAVAVEVAGAAALLTGPGPDPASGLVAATSLSIAGGTTEVNKNIVAERVLGLPRDPSR